MPEFDGRHELEWRYSIEVSGQVVTHRHSFDIKLADDYPPGEDFGDIETVPRVGAGEYLGDWCQFYADVFTPLLGVGTTLEEIILWRYDDEPSQAKIYINSIATLPTTSYVGTPVTAQGAIFTFRQAGYRYPMRMYVMEGTQGGEERYPVSAFAGDNLAYAEFVIDAASPIQGRADVYPIACIALNLGQNEKLRNIRYR